ncbi:MAG: hypothetical protein ACLSGF_06465 [Alistipes onderdonkii]
MSCLDSTGGINNTFRYKRLSLNVYCDFALGHSIINGMKAHLLRNTMGNCNSTIGRIAYDCWQHPGDTDAKYARFFPNDSDWGNSQLAPIEFSWLKKPTICVSRDVSLYYDLPGTLAAQKSASESDGGRNREYALLLDGSYGGHQPRKRYRIQCGAGMYTPVSTSTLTPTSPPI